MTRTACSLPENIVERLARASYEAGPPEMVDTFSSDARIPNCIPRYAKRPRRWEDVSLMTRETHLARARAMLAMPVNLQVETRL